MRCRMKIIDASDKSPTSILRLLDVSRPPSSTDVRKVQLILDDVRKRGDKAVVDWVRKLDKVRLQPKNFEVPKAVWARAWERLPSRMRTALKSTADRVRAFHKTGVPESAWLREGGSHLGKIVIPLSRVGIYVPGGPEGYPSTVLMTAVPARVAGVRDICVLTPPRKGGPPPTVLAAAHAAEVDRVFQVGGPVAIAAMAYGTETIPRVDKIVGPGNAYVTLAKKLVFGDVGIDMLAGPTELVLMADESADATWVAADLAAQAEHGIGSISVVVASSKKVLEDVSSAFDRDRVLKRLSKDARARCVGVLVKSWSAAVDLTNAVAPEHVEIMVRDSGPLVQNIRCAGAMFVGPWSPVALGDYTAGPSHVLPTGRSARFSSALGVEDFLRRMTFISIQEPEFAEWAPKTIELAESERFVYHAYSVKKRVQDRKKQTGVGSIG